MCYEVCSPQVCQQVSVLDLLWEMKTAAWLFLINRDLYGWAHRGRQSMSSSVEPIPVGRRALGVELVKLMPWRSMRSSY